MKRLMIITVIAIIAVAAGWNFNQSKNEVELSDLALANVEALATPELGGGGACYKTITHNEFYPNYYVFYCIGCRYVPCISSSDISICW